MKLSEVAKVAIDLASAIRDYWNAELPKRHPNYPVVLPGEDSGPPPPETKELADLLTSLPESDIYRLAPPMGLGRGDFGTEDLAGHYEILKERLAKPARAIALMMGKAPLAEYLTDGLAELNKTGIDPDDLVQAVHSGR